MGGAWAGGGGVEGVEVGGEDAGGLEGHFLFLYSPSVYCCGGGGGLYAVSRLARRV